MLAERWGVPPWVIMEHPDGLKWINRQALVDDLRRQNAELEAKKRAREARMK